ncbi:RES family NAD+ phosphorylase [Millionella massiliensis]|uniref:RES family NAD+ phosphorylase n=1 Tax=Millionella massiliensis TaxID=1871023 RepID=UPI0009F5DCFA|nr:RES family NAD+ phosphorylase [Millionella massiliensis]
MYVCQNCFSDQELKSDIASNATRTGVCDICGTTEKLIDFSELYDFFSALLSLFTGSSNGNKTIVDLVQGEWCIFKDKKVADALLRIAISACNCNYSINTIVDYTDDIKYRIAIWDRLKKSIRENSRFFTNIDEFAQHKYLTPGKSLSTGHKLYRSRILPIDKKKITRNHMGCPPREYATAGRANPIGIPYLYLSDSAKTTYFEVRAVYLDKLCVGLFEVQRELKLVDFIYDVDLYLAYNDASTSLKEVVIKKKVIDAISNDLSKPLRRYDSELEYVPTQFICEYCKQIVGADGISFTSSLFKEGRNYVLFDDSAAKCMTTRIHEITHIDIDRKNTKAKRY